MTEIKRKFLKHFIRTRFRADLFELHLSEDGIERKTDKRICVLCNGFYTATAMVRHLHYHHKLTLNEIKSKFPELFRDAVIHVQTKIQCSICKVHYSFACMPEHIRRIHPMEYKILEGQLMTVIQRAKEAQDLKKDINSISTLEKWKYQLEIRNGLGPTYCIGIQTIDEVIKILDMSGPDEIKKYVGTSFTGFCEYSEELDIDIENSMKRMVGCKALEPIAKEDLFAEVITEEKKEGQ